MKNYAVYLVFIIILIVSCSKNGENNINNFTKINAAYLSDFTILILDPYSKNILSKIPNQYIILASIQNLLYNTTFKNYIDKYSYIFKRFSKEMDYNGDNKKETGYLISELTSNNIELMNSEIDSVHIFNYLELKIL
ncbi:hypothetical protein R4K55_10735 [Brachyspira alvinipulli]|uniref:hypothetical protein n=1 Tax=Brachyspira alvinipulli TaxID=84379 RepID=UPI0030061BE6